MTRNKFTAWNGSKWERFKTFKEACNMLKNRFDEYIISTDHDKANAMDGEQINILTPDDYYSYARVEIIKGDFTIKKYKHLN